MKTCKCGYSTKSHGIGYWTNDGWVCKECGDLHTLHTDSIDNEKREPSKTITLKLKKLDELNYHIKSGRKIIAKIQSVTEGFYTMSKIFSTLDVAIEYVRLSKEDTYNAFGGNNIVEIVNA